MYIVYIVLNSKLKKETKLFVSITKWEDIILLSPMTLY